MTRVRLSEDVVYRSFGAETVLLNLKTGQYHGLRGSGGRMLELLSETGDVDETARRIADEFDQPVENVTRDVNELCAGLRERQLMKDA
jgi:hypothetical protein